MDWKDRHGVTCLLCGGIADETETVNIRPGELDPALVNENPKYVSTVEDIANALGEGEAHSECFEYVLENDFDPAEVDLDSIDHR